MKSKDIEILLKWLQIREANGIKFPHSLSQLWADVDHSSLLNRMLDGIEPLEKAPPRSFSYPNYKLIEQGWGEPFEVCKAYNEGFIIIDQAIWKLVKQLGEDDFEVEWPGRDGEVWRVFSTGNRKDSDRKLWRIELK